MQLGKILCAMAALAGTTLTVACDNAAISINGEHGKPLTDLDLSGPPPHSLALLGPDTVAITTGDHLAISVTGPADAAARLRFTLKNGTLGILRKDGLWQSGADTAVVVHVTMPPPSSLAMMGSGTINAPTLAPKADISIGGSGDITVPQAGTERLVVNIGGSGSFTGGGRVARLELNIGGSGRADLAALHADHAEVNIAGSGDSRFASDGTVKANILGSGTVRVAGRAHCTVSAIGSGRLICTPGDGQGVAADKGDEDDSSPDSADSDD